MLRRCWGRAKEGFGKGGRMGGGGGRGERCWGRGVGGEEKSGGRGGGEIPVGAGEREEGFGNGGRKWVEEVLGGEQKSVCVGCVCVCVGGGGGTGGREGEGDGGRGVAKEELGMKKEECKRCWV